MSCLDVNGIGLFAPHSSIMKLKLKLGDFEGMGVNEPLTGVDSPVLGTNSCSGVVSLDNPCICIFLLPGVCLT